jgi:hypothetical protein
MTMDMKNIPSDVFKNCKQLETVTMRRNSFTVFPDFENCPLKDVEYQYNELTEFPNLPSFGAYLTSVRLLKNKITKIHPFFFHAGKRISTDVLSIDLRLNYIQVIPPWLGYIDDVVTIDVTNNPINCDHSLAWISAVRNVTVIGFCKKPGHLAGTALGDVQFEQITNENKGTVYLINF